MSYDFSKLTHVEVAELWEKRFEIFKQNEIDLASNQKMDSSGIAFLVQWAKSTKERQLTIKHASENVVSLIKTFHLEPLFVLEK